LQAEREAEGGLYAEKEEFVTQVTCFLLICKAYLDKMRDQKEAEEKDMITGLIDYFS
jgi:hypothetical protein